LNSGEAASAAALTPRAATTASKGSVVHPFSHLQQSFSTLSAEGGNHFFLASSQLGSSSFSSSLASRRRQQRQSGLASISSLVAIEPVPPCSAVLLSGFSHRGFSSLFEFVKLGLRSQHSSFNSSLNFSGVQFDFQCFNRLLPLRLATEGLAEVLSASESLVNRCHVCGEFFGCHHLLMSPIAQRFVCIETLGFETHDGVHRETCELANVSSKLSVELVNAFLNFIKEFLLERTVLSERNLVLAGRDEDALQASLLIRLGRVQQGHDAADGTNVSRRVRMTSSQMEMRA
jgi:hypothetical protein